MPILLLAMHVYPPASSSDTLRIRKVLLKFSNLTFCNGRSPPLLNHSIVGVGLEMENKTTCWKHLTNYCTQVWFPLNDRCPPIPKHLLRYRLVSEYSSILTLQQLYTPTEAVLLVAPFWSWMRLLETESWAVFLAHYELLKKSWETWLDALRKMYCKQQVIIASLLWIKISFNHHIQYTNVNVLIYCVLHMSNTVRKIQEMTSLWISKIVTLPMKVFFVIYYKKSSYNT